MTINHHSIIIAVILVTGALIGAVVIFAFTYRPYSGHNTPPPTCPEESCKVFWFGDGYYELRGPAYDRYLQKCQGGTGCAWVAVNASNYMLTDEAYITYQNIDNIGIPLFTISFESRYLPISVPYLLNIYGPTSDVESMAIKYNVTKAYSKIDYDNVTSFTGWISKENLVRFLNENHVESLATKEVLVSRALGYTVGNETVNRIEFSLPNEDKLNEEIQAYREAEISAIVKNEKTGVLRLNSEEFFPFKDTEAL